MRDMLRHFFTEGVSREPIVNLVAFQLAFIMAPTLFVFWMREKWINFRAWRANR